MRYINLRFTYLLTYLLTQADTDSYLLFQKWSKSVQDKWPKGCIVW